MKASESFVAAVCGMNSIDDVETNTHQLFHLLEEAVKGGAEFISFPENCLYLRIDESGEKYALPIDHAVFRRLSKFCREKNVCLHLGSVPVRSDNKIWNSTFLIREDGSCERVYDKMHLFDIELAGQKAIRESDYYHHGMAPKVLEWRGFRFGLSICYDLRFAELYNYYAKEEVDVLLIPAAFLVETGRAHWEVLLRARAIENQCYVLAAGQGGEHKGKNGATRRTYGHSMIIEPWGEVIAQTDESSQVVLAELQREKITAVRRQIPMGKHRRWNDFMAKGTL